MFKNRILASALLVSSFFSNSTKAGHLYKVTSKDGVSVSYLFGTIHLMPKGADKMSSTLDRAFVESNVLYTEVNLNNMEEMKSAASLMALPDGKPLESFVDESRVMEIQKLLEKEYRITPEEFEKMKLIQPFLWSKVIMEKAMPELEKGFDFKINNKANEMKIQVLGLSTMSEEIKSISKIDIVAQIEMIFKMVQKKNELTRESLMMFEAYQKDDSKMLKDLIYKGLKETPGASVNLLEDRNKKWAEKLNEPLQKGSLFIAVGAAHLIGEKSLIVYLQEKGYKIEKVEEQR
jgi:uncharacterized protein